MWVYQHKCDRVGGCLRAGPVDVPVDIHGYLDGLVAKVPRHDGQRNAGLYQPRCASMPQVVDPGRWVEFGALNSGIPDVAA